MTTSDHSLTPRRRLASRRQFLLGGAVAGVGAAVAIGADQLLARPSAPAALPETEQLHGSETVMFHGKHQAGIDTPPQAHATFIALDLREHVDRDDLRRLMRVLTDDAARLTAGRAAIVRRSHSISSFPRCE